MQKKIVLIDENEIIMSGLKTLFYHIDLYKVVQTFNFIDIDEHLLMDYMPDMLLINSDISSKEKVIHFISSFKSRYNYIKILTYSYNVDIDYLIKLVNNGGDGDININKSFKEFMDAIKEAFNDNIYIHPDILPQFNHRMVKNEILKENVDDLTKREIQILQFVSKGMLNKEIASALGISERTVKNHISNIFKKIKVTDRTQAAVYAIKHGIAEI
ncbi:MAG: response regulator transcription factor [Lachnospira sp.]|nr:response regulator transcription factor [Lachnospira sp.]